MGKKLQIEKMVGRPLTADYQPNHYGDTNQSLRMPPFTLHYVPVMMRDYRIRLGMRTIKGPILMRAQFSIQGDDSLAKGNPVYDWIKETITRFWTLSAPTAMKAYEWGYSCSEQLWKIEDGQLKFDRLKPLHSLDARCWTVDGKIKGATIRNVPGKKQCNLVGMKMFWHVHDREANNYYGLSRLYGAFVPWNDKYGEGGHRDSEKLWMRKYAYDGGILYHPPGMSQISLPNGAVAAIISNKDLAREMLDKKKNGGTMTLPNTLISDGSSSGRAWEYVPPTAAEPPLALFEQGDKYDDRMLEGLGVPPEILTADGTGAFAGRAIPMQSFFASEQELLTAICTDMYEQILRPGVDAVFGPGIPFNVVPFPLLEKEEQEQGSEPGSGQQPPETNPNQQ